jgi:hypothetical protein
MINLKCDKSNLNIDKSKYLINLKYMINLNI